MRSFRSTFPKASPMAEDYVESYGEPMANKNQPLIAIPHVPGEAVQWLVELLDGKLDDKLSPGYPIKIRGIVLSLDDRFSRIVIKATIDGEAVMVLVDGDDILELIGYLNRRLERGTIRWSVDRYSK